MSLAAQDFPFFEGRPRRLTAARWAAGLATCAVAFGALELVTHVWPGPWGAVAGMLSFGVCNVLALVAAAGHDWTAVFHRPGWRDLLLGLGGALLSIVVSSLIGWAVLVASRGAVAGNPAIGNLHDLHGLARVAFFAGMAPQLLGEEILTILPFLAILTLATGPLRWGRTAAIGVAWAGSSLIFAAVHLPTYDWHVGQTLATIGVARLSLTVPYLLTRNLWSSTIAHIANDWGLFALMAALTTMR